MSEQQNLDPSGSTQQFRAFAQQAEAQSGSSSGGKSYLVIGLIVVAAIVIIGLIALFTL